MSEINIDSISASPSKDLASSANPLITNIHHTLHSIYNPQEQSYTSHTQQILIALHDTLLSQQAVSSLKKEQVQEYINALVNSHIFETHLFPLINLEALPPAIIQVLYAFMERLVFCVKTFASDSCKRHVKELFAFTTDLWANIIKQTASCINYNMVKDAPWSLKGRCKVSIFEMCSKTLQPLLLGIDLLNRVLEIENPKIAYSTSKIENLHSAILQRLEKEHFLDLIVLAAQKLSLLIGASCPDLDKEVLLKPALYILKACSLIFHFENVDEMVWACEYGEKYDQQLLSQFYKAQRHLEVKLQENLPTRHTRFGGKLLRKLNVDEEDDDEENQKVPTVIVDSLQISNQYTVEDLKSKPKSYIYRKSQIVKRLPFEIEPSGYKIKSLLKLFAEKLLSYKFRDVIHFLTTYFILDRDLPVASKDMLMPLQSKEDLFRVARFILCVNRGNSEAKARAENPNNPKIVLSTESIVDYIDMNFLDSAFLFLRMNSDPQSRKNIDKIVTHQLYNLLEEIAGYVKEVTITLLYMLQNGSKTQFQYAHKAVLTINYERENLRSLIKLLRHYNSSKNSRIYLCDLIDSIHYFLHALQLVDDGSLTVKKIRTHTSTRITKEETEQIRDINFSISMQIMPHIARKHVLDKYMLLLKNFKNVRSSTILSIISLLKRVVAFEADINTDSSVLYNMNFISIFFSITQDVSFLEPNAMEDIKNTHRLQEYNSFIQFIYQIFEKMFMHFRSESTFHFSRLVFGEQRSLATDEQDFSNTQDEYQASTRVQRQDEEDEENEYQFSQEHEYQFSQEYDNQQLEQSTKEKQVVNKPKHQKIQKKTKRLRKKGAGAQVERLSQALNKFADNDDNDDNDEIAYDEEDRLAVEHALRAKVSEKMDDTEEEIVFDEDDSNASDEASHHNEVLSSHISTEYDESTMTRDDPVNNKSLDDSSSNISSSFPPAISTQKKSLAESIDLAQLQDSMNMSGDSLVIVDEVSDEEKMEDIMEKEGNSNVITSTFGDNVTPKPINRQKDRKNNSKSKSHAKFDHPSSLTIQTSSSEQASGLDLSQATTNHVKNSKKLKRSAVNLPHPQDSLIE